MEPDMKERKEFIYIPSHIVFHPANETTPGVMRNHFHFQYTPLHFRFQYNVLMPVFLSSLQKIQIWHTDPKSAQGVSGVSRVMWCCIIIMS